MSGYTVPVIINGVKGNVHGFGIGTTGFTIYGLTPALIAACYNVTESVSEIELDAEVELFSGMSPFKCKLGMPFPDDVEIKGYGGGRVENMTCVNGTALEGNGWYIENGALCYDELQMKGMLK